MPPFKSLTSVAVLTAIALAFAVPAMATRTWTDVQGRTIEAEYLSRNGGEVTIRRSNGIVYTFPVDLLSDEDRRYIHEQPSIPFPEISFRGPAAEDTVAALIRYGTEEGWNAVAERLRSEVIAEYSGPAPALHDWYLVYRWADLFQDEPFHAELRTSGSPFGHDWPYALRRFAIGNPGFSWEFFRLISPRDNTGEVSSILKRLYELDPQVFEAYSSLALAIAVVYDQQPPGRWPHSQVSQSLLPRRLHEPEEVFAFFVESHRGGRLLLNPQRLSAAELRFTVDIVAPFEELRWAQQRVRNGVRAFANVYSSVQYDYSRYSPTVSNPQYHWGHEDYRLSTILNLGGICVDQAYFATQTGKARGLPTLYFSGAGNNASHAWFGYLVGLTGGWNLDIGRYSLDNYVTGYALDPQTWDRIRDHDIAFLQERFHSSVVYRNSLLHSDFSREFQLMGDTGNALASARRALDIDSRNRDAWEVALGIQNDARNTAAYERGLRDASGAFFRYPDIEAHYINLLAESLLSRNEREAAVAELQRISRKNRSSRPDISLAKARAMLNVSREHDPIEEQIATFRRLLSDQRSHAPAMGIFLELVRPFHNHLDQNGYNGEARGVISQARRTLNPANGTQLYRDLNNLANRIRG